MSDRPDPDTDLLRELGSLIARIDPPPPVVTEFAKAALDWRRLDAELAELLADSALETASEALTRSGEAGVRWVTFRTAALAIDVEVEADDDARTLRGQIAPPPDAARVEVQGADGTVLATADVDSLGRFRIELEAAGRLRLRILSEGAEPAVIETSWLTL